MFLEENESRPTGARGPVVAFNTIMEAIYQRPRDYDLEHEGDDEDVAFYVKLLDTWQPRRVMELASGSGPTLHSRPIVVAWPSM